MTRIMREAPPHKNKKMNIAKKVKNDEFYTFYDDISHELSHYADELRGCKIYCNADDPASSQFFQYFKNNYERMELRNLTATGFSTNRSTFGHPVGVEYDGTSEKTIDLISADFRSIECENILAECDAVVTNPPFSLFREHMNLTMNHGKKFLIIGNIVGAMYRDIFDLIVKSEIYRGQRIGGGFMTSAASVTKAINACWYSNMRCALRGERIELNNIYNEEEYPKYDTIDAINVDRMSKIPFDYEGVMGVPISLLDNYSTEQFEILGVTEANTTVRGKTMYRRILIRNRNAGFENAVGSLTKCYKEAIFALRNREDVSGFPERFSEIFYKYQSRRDGEAG